MALVMMLLVEFGWVRRRAAAEVEAILVDPWAGGKNPQRISRKAAGGSNDWAPGKRAPASSL